MQVQQQLEAMAGKALAVLNTEGLKETHVDLGRLESREATHLTSR